MTTARVVRCQWDPRGRLEVVPVLPPGAVSVEKVFIQVLAARSRVGELNGLPAAAGVGGGGCDLCLVGQLEYECDSVQCIDSWCELMAVDVESLSWSVTRYSLNTRQLAISQETCHQAWEYDN